MINFPFGTNGKLIILGVPILKHITVMIGIHSTALLKTRPVTGPG